MLRVLYLCSKSSVGAPVVEAGDERLVVTLRGHSRGFFRNTTPAHIGRALISRHVAIVLAVGCIDI